MTKPKSKPKIKHLKLSTVKKKANKAFSEYIRVKYSNDLGVCECYTCGGKFYYKTMDCGHAITGRNNAVLYMEDLVRPQCKQCNIFKNGNLAVFTKKLILEYGIEKYEQLEALAEQTVIYKVPDYQDIEILYKEKLDQLK